MQLILILFFFKKVSKGVSMVCNFPCGTKASKERVKKLTSIVSQGSDLISVDLVLLSNIHDVTHIKR